MGGYETSKRGGCELHEKNLKKVNCNNKGEGKGKDKDESSSRKGKGSQDKDEDKGKDKGKDKDKSSGGGDSSSAQDGDKQKWEHVGNGACRMKDGGRGTYDKIADKGMSEKDCR